MLLVPTIPAGSGKSDSITSTDPVNVPAGVAVGDVVYISGPDSVDKVDNSNPNKMPAIAVVIDKPTTTTASLLFFGIVSGYSGLIPGSTIYAGINGQITDTAPNTNIQKIGEALNSTTILFHPELKDNGHYFWTVNEYAPTAGQITYILTRAPLDIGSLEFYVNGVLVDDVTDYVVSGTTVTWLNTAYVIETTDKVTIKYQ